MTGVKLNPCPLCRGEAREIDVEDLHVSFAIYDDKDGSIEFNFLHYGGINCAGCGLLLPFHDADENRVENIEFWNGRAGDIVAPDPVDEQLDGWRAVLARARREGVDLDFTDALGEACDLVEDLERELRASRARINDLEAATGGSIP